MTVKHQIRLVLIGFVIWATGTLVFRLIGAYLFERSTIEYWITVIGIGVLSTAISVGLMKWWRIQAIHWLQGAICIALPGMLGEIPILSNFSALMSSMQPETAGRYAALLFGGYASLISFTWLMSTKAGSQLSPDSH